MLFFTSWLLYSIRCRLYASLASAYALCARCCPFLPVGRRSFTLIIYLVMVQSGTHNELIIEVLAVVLAQFVHLDVVDVVDVLVLSRLRQGRLITSPSWRS